jgi:hypothetical protein
MGMVIRSEIQLSWAVAINSKQFEWYLTRAAGTSGGPFRLAATLRGRKRNDEFHFITRQVKSNFRTIVGNYQDPGIRQTT